MTGFCQTFQITIPVVFVTRAQIMQHAPGVQSRIVAVIEDDPHGVASDRLDALDSDGLLSCDEYTLTG